LPSMLIWTLAACKSWQLPRRKEVHHKGCLARNSFTRPLASLRNSTRYPCRAPSRRDSSAPGIRSASREALPGGYLDAQQALAYGITCSDQASRLFCSVPLHKIRYGVQFEEAPGRSLIKARLESKRTSRHSDLTLVLKPSIGTDRRNI
jgi:hypothetical protein